MRVAFDECKNIINNVEKMKNSDKGFVKSLTQDQRKIINDACNMILKADSNSQHPNDIKVSKKNFDALNIKLANKSKKRSLLSRIGSKFNFLPGKIKSTTLEKKIDACKTRISSLDTSIENNKVHKNPPGKFAEHRKAYPIPQNDRDLKLQPKQGSPYDQILVKLKGDLEAYSKLMDKINERNEELIENEHQELELYLTQAQDERPDPTDKILEFQLRLQSFEKIVYFSATQSDFAERIKKCKSELKDSKKIQLIQKLESETKAKTENFLNSTKSHLKKMQTEWENLEQKETGIIRGERIDLKKLVRKKEKDLLDWLNNYGEVKSPFDF